MSDLTSFRAVLDLWPSREALADEISATGLKCDSRLVSKWWQRNKIAADWWSVILRLPRAVEAGVTAELFAAWAAREREVA